MLKTLLAMGTFCSLLLPGFAMAQTPNIGVSSGSTVANFSGYSETTGQTWGTYQALDLAVQSAGAGTVGIVPNLGSLSLGTVGALELVYQEGGYTGQSFTRQDFTGQSVTSQTNF